MDLFRRKSSNSNASLSKSENTNDLESSIFNSSSKSFNSQNTPNTPNSNQNNANDFTKTIRNSVEIGSKYQFFEVEADEEEVEKMMKEILVKIEDVENRDTKKYLMEKYSDLEIELLKSVKNSNKKLNLNQRKFLKIFIYENLHAKFLEKNSDERRRIESKISYLSL